MTPERTIPQQAVIVCPNPKCQTEIYVEEGRNEIMCHGCGVTIDLPMPQEDSDD